MLSNPWSSDWNSVCVCVLEIGWDSLELREKEEIAWARDQRGGSVAWAVQWNNHQDSAFD